MRRGSWSAWAGFLLLAACGNDSAPSAGEGGAGQTAQGGVVSAGGHLSSSGGASGGTSGGESPNASGGMSGTGQGGALTATGGKASGAGGATGGSGSAAQGGVTAGGSSSGGSKASGGASNGMGGRSSPSGGANSGGKATGSGGTPSMGGSAGATSSAPTKVWIAGDSTVQNCSSACPCGWGSQFDPLFNNNVTVQNSAVGGRSIQTWLYEANVSSTLANGECTLTATTYNARWTAMLNATSGMKSGDYLFIQFGINDGDRTCPRHVGLELFRTYLGAMAQAAKDRGAQPIFVTPVSAISCNSSGKAVGTRGEFVTTTIEAGMAFDVPVIDLHQRSVDLYNSLGFCPNNADYSSGIVGAFFCEDHTHFEAAGAVQIAKLVAAALRDQKLALAAYLL